MGDTTASVLAAGTVVRNTGFDVDAAPPVVLHEGSSVLVGFGALGPVARVGGLTAGIRDLSATYGREVALARHLVAQGAPVVPPWEPAGPFEQAGHVVSLWQRARTADRPDAATAGKALKRCHLALLEFTDPPPGLRWLLDEAEHLVNQVSVSTRDRGAFARAFRYSRRVVDEHGLPEQALHGDAGLANVLEGGLWHDWEDSCSGPVLWDLASVVSTARILGRDAERAEGVLRAYGDAPGLDQIDAFVSVRGLQVLAWSLLASKNASRTRASTRDRLRWFRSHPWPAT